jgi:hypothetical protein
VLIHDSSTAVTGVGHVRVESICGVWPIASRRTLDARPGMRPLAALGARAAR